MAILALPYPCIRRLQMSGHFKVELSFVFLLGTLLVNPSFCTVAVSNSQHADPMKITPLRRSTFIFRRV